MHRILDRNTFAVKEHLGWMKLTSSYDVLDPSTGETLLECRELRVGLLVKTLRLLGFKTLAPFRIDIQTPDGEPVLSVRRGFSAVLSRVVVEDERDAPIGQFKQRLLSIGGSFNVQTLDGETLCTLKGSLIGRKFRFLRDKIELARVHQRWAGLGRELFSTADSYVIEIEDTVPPGNPLRGLILAAALCVDQVLKEGKR